MNGPQADPALKTGLLSCAASMLGVVGTTILAVQALGSSQLSAQIPLAAILGASAALFGVNGLATAGLLKGYRRLLGEVETVLAADIPPQEADAERRQVASVSRIKASLLNAGPDVERIADFDPLTGLGNQHWLKLRAAHEMKRIERDGGPVSLILLRVEHLDKIVETHGVDAADTALLWVADMLRNTVRSYDLVARLGDGEFCALLPGATQTVASNVAKRLKIAVEMAPQVLMQNKTLQISCAVTAPEEPDTTVETLIQRGRVELGTAPHEATNE
ncbi:GGDEF domain-containing protein [Alsobacter sp. SYSU M60028]|uniref:diguanylate cyclase n=1 Tax=Alsobacter ponti TaxID=2962936 RepID=A0ABT1LAP6_9HYPH|nr:GGDEF domain-containing protein [Alsobacter ponti]MCP8937850.1 GGDEF domain-containing protein [Alsobacter ponti]